MANRERLPTLSNEAQLKIMNMVKQGMSMDEALKRAAQMEAAEKSDDKAEEERKKAASKASQSSPNLRRSTVSQGSASPMSIKKQASNKDINRATLDAVTKMVQDGNISAEDAIRHAEALAAVRVRKKGDAQRILLMNMVKEGNMSIDDAVRHAKLMGVDVDSAPKRGAAPPEEKVYNFGVYKLNKVKGPQRRILQLDFQSGVMCNVSKGHRTNQFKFDQIEKIESDDGVAFTVHFTGEARPPVEYEADSLEEKNKIFRLMTTIVDANNGGSAPTAEGQEAGPVSSTPKLDAVPAKIIKEGRIEKKGHSVAYFHWQSRWLIVRPRELAYFKEDDLENPLNIIPLGVGVASVTKKNNDIFVIHTNKKAITFRVPAPQGFASSTAVQQERDAWFDAVMEAIDSGPATAPTASGPSSACLLESQITALTDIIKMIVLETASLSAYVTEAEGNKKISSLQNLTEDLVKNLSMLAVVDNTEGKPTANPLAAGLRQGRQEGNQPAHDGSPSKGVAIALGLDGDAGADGAAAAAAGAGGAGAGAGGGGGGAGGAGAGGAGSGTGTGGGTGSGTGDGSGAGAAGAAGAVTPDAKKAGKTKSVGPVAEAKKVDSITVTLSRPNEDVSWGFGLSPGYEIVELDASSIAAKAGIVIGMVLKSVNGSSVVPDRAAGLSGEKCMSLIEEGLGALEVKLALGPKDAPAAPSFEAKFEDTQAAAKEEALRKEKEAEQKKREEESLKRKIEETKAEIEVFEKEVARLTKAVDIADAYQRAKKKVDAAKEDCALLQAKLAEMPPLTDSEISSMRQRLSDLDAAIPAAREVSESEKEELEKLLAPVTEAEELMQIAESEEDKAAAQAYLDSVKEEYETAKKAMDDERQARVRALVLKKKDITDGQSYKTYKITLELEECQKTLASEEESLAQLLEKYSALTDIARLEAAYKDAIDAHALSKKKADKVRESVKDPEKLVQQAQEVVAQVEAKLAAATEKKDQDAIAQAEAQLKKAKGNVELARKPEFLVSVAESDEGAKAKAAIEAKQALERARAQLEVGPDVKALAEELKIAQQALTTAQHALRLLQPSLNPAIPVPPPLPPLDGSIPIPPPLPPLEGGVPPPPPLPGGIPAPPPLGPNGVPMPPAFPGFGAAPLARGQLPARKAVTLTSKMRIFHWIKLANNAIEKTFWAKYLKENDRPLNAQILEEQFAEREVKEIKSKKKEEMQTLLDGKRAQNIGIFMSGFKLPLHEIDAKLNILPPSEDAMPVEHIISLRKLGPTPEEIEMYKKYQGDKSKLSDIDQFVLRMMEIPNFKQRLDLLLKVHEFPLQFEELAPEVSLALSACKELQESQLLEEALLYVLSIGNFLNSGTNKGGAYGIGLKSLTKLADSRANDKKSSLLDFLIYTLESNEEKKGLADFTQELRAVAQATETSVKGLTAEVEILARDLLKIHKESENMKAAIKEMNDSQAEFFAAIERFVNLFEGKLVTLHAETQETAQRFVSVVEKFGEKPNTDSEEVFGTVATFIEQYDRQRTLLREQREKEIRDALAREKKEKERALQAQQRQLAEAASSEKTHRKAASLGQTKMDGIKHDATNPFDKGGATNPFAAPKLNALSTSPNADRSAMAAAASSSAAAPALRHVETAARAASARADPDDPNRPGGYGGLAEEKSFDVNAVNPFSKSTKAAPAAPYNPFAPKAVEKTPSKAAPAKAKEKRPPPSREGYLEKLSGGKNKTAKWDKRYFEIANTGYMHYYKKEGGKNDGSVYLKGCSARLDPEDPTILLVQTEDRLYTLRCATVASTQDWLADITYYTSS